MNISLPNDVMKSIAHHLDQETILSLGCCSKANYALTNEVLQDLYVAPYASGYGNEPPSKMNARVVTIAKRLWRNSKANPIKAWQYRTLKVYDVNEVNKGHAVVNMRLLRFKDEIELYSKDGCRHQRTPLNLEKKDPLTIKPLRPSMIEQPLRALVPENEQGALKAAAGGLLAVVVEKNQIQIFEEKEGALIHLTTFDSFKDQKDTVIHAILFSNTLELFFTTTDGYIYGIPPFGVAYLGFPTKPATCCAIV